MAETGWVIAPFGGKPDDTVAAAVVQCFSGIYQRHFRDEWLVNHGLPVEVRALRESDGWRVMLLLTPWMLARVFLAQRDPGLPIPAGWGAAERGEAPYVVIGPMVPFPVLGFEQKAHLNYLPELGHFLLQPLVQSMERYKSADEVFGAWDEVIRTRDRVMEEQKRECGWQREVSRREFLGRLAGR
jgi:hypothetical protein